MEIIIKFLGCFLLMFLEPAIGPATLGAEAAMSGALIPGRSCGIQTPYRVLDKLTKDHIIEELPCAIVLNTESFKEFYLAKTVGKILTMHEIMYQPKNMWIDFFFINTD